MSKSTSIVVQDQTIRVTKENTGDFICITDMINAKEGTFFVSDWLRNRNTLEFLAVWEQLHNPDFNYGEFAIIASSSGLNSYKISVKEWIEKTNAIGLKAKTGRYGGTYAHQDIAFEFGTWISPVFKLYLIKEFQRLKEIENDPKTLEWDVKRILSKANYTIHTKAIQYHRIPFEKVSQSREWIIYADEADMLNMVVFGMTAKQWQMSNPDLHKKGENIRDSASINELAVLSNMESLNAAMLQSSVPKEVRFKKLYNIATEQLEALRKYDFTKSFKKGRDGGFIAPVKAVPVVPIDKTELSSFNQKLKKALGFSNKKQDD